MKIHHFAISVSDIFESKRFYLSLLEPAGFRLVVDTEDFVAIEGESFELLLYKAKSELANRRHVIYQPGFHHLALMVTDAIKVDLAAAAMSSVGATILERPKHYPDYPGKYYAVFATDPDGLKIEVMTM